MGTATSPSPRAGAGSLSLKLGRYAPYQYKQNLPPPAWETSGPTPHTNNDDFAEEALALLKRWLDGQEHLQQLLRHPQLKLLQRRRWRNQSNYLRQHLRQSLRHRSKRLPHHSGHCRKKAALEKKELTKARPFPSCT